MSEAEDEFGIPGGELMNKGVTGQNLVETGEMMLKFHHSFRRGQIGGNFDPYFETTPE